MVKNNYIRLKVQNDPPTKNFEVYRKVKIKKDGSYKDLKIGELREGATDQAEVLYKKDKYDKDGNPEIDMYASKKNERKILDKNKHTTFIYDYDFVPEVNIAVTKQERKKLNQYAKVKAKLLNERYKADNDNSYHACDNKFKAEKNLNVYSPIKEKQKTMKKQRELDEYGGIC